jgi:hypothetical protein
MVKQSELITVINLHNRTVALAGKIARRLLDGEHVEPGEFRIEMAVSEDYGYMDGTDNYFNLGDLSITGEPEDESTAIARSKPDDFIVEPQPST